MPKPIKDVPDAVSIKHPGLRKLLERRGEEATERRGTNKHLDKDEAEFWLCLVFQSNAQLQEFMQHIPEVPILYNAYVDGESFAEVIGKPVSPVTTPLIRAKAHPIGKQLAAKPRKS